MIDTIRFRGPAGGYRYKWNMQRFYVFRNESGDEYTPSTLIENKKDAKKNSIYRAFYMPTSDFMDVELNIGKLLFTHNIYNYENSSANLNTLIRRFGDCFFNSSDYYVTRIDLGHLQTYASKEETRNVIERYRHSRLPGSYARKFKHQNYADSVFYKAEGWSIKVYDKHAEMVHNLGESIANELIPDKNMLRFEKTYRVREIQRIGKYPTVFDSKGEAIGWGQRYTIEKYKGVHIDSFDIGPIMEDYTTTFKNWEFAAIPYITDHKGALGLLSIIDSYGGLSEIEGTGVVSKMTFHRYKKVKKTTHPPPPFKIVENITPEMKQKVSYCVTFSPAHLLI